MKSLNLTSENIFIEQVRLLYANSMVAMPVSIMVGSLLCWLQRFVVSPTVLVAWFTLFTTISIARIYLLFLFKKEDPANSNMNRWNTYFLIGTYGVAAVYGSASFFLFPEHSLSNQTLFFLIMVGLTAGAVASLSPSLPAVTGFLSLLLLPLSLKMMTFGSDNSLLVGLLVLAFLAVTLFGTIKINTNIRENIQLRIQSVERETILKVSEERYRHIFDNAPLGIFHYDSDSIIVDCNDAFAEMLGAPKDKLINFNMLEEVKERRMIKAIQDSLTIGHGYFEGNYTSFLSNKTAPIRTFLKAIKSPDQTIIGGVGIAEDFTDKRLSEQQVQYHTTYDALTGLPNRRLLLTHLRNELSRSRRHGHYSALLFIDLDNFKTINDSLGHSVGDELLKIVAQRITESTRQEDSVARMGGDEFIIILTELSDTIELATDKARVSAEKISLCLSAPCEIENHELHVTPSIGVSLFPKPDTKADDILKQADTAMYMAKASGRNGIHFFLPEMQEMADKRLFLNTEIRKALNNGELNLYYQPQVNGSGDLIGAEALIRWHHPVKGVVPPGAFLPIAEETGIMKDIGHWVLQSACQQIKLWTDAQLLEDSQIIFINISGKEFTTPDFVNKVISTLEETGAAPKHLGIELTEGSLISTGGDTVEKVMALQQMGIKFSVDDFGTGYSSLSYLKSLPLNTIKIDRSFVNDIKDAIDGIVLVDTIIMMAQNLGLGVIAEGVETEEELLYLNARGCVVYQGYFFSKPVPAAAFTTILESKNSILA